MKFNRFFERGDSMKKLLYILFAIGLAVTSVYAMDEDGGGTCNQDETYKQDGDSYKQDEESYKDDESYKNDEDSYKDDESCKDEE
jgi:uncharacterized protein YxeA